VTLVDLQTGLLWESELPLPTLQLMPGVADPMFLDGATVWVQGYYQGYALSTVTGKTAWIWDLHMPRVTPSPDGRSRPVYAEHLVDSATWGRAADAIVRLDPAS